MSLPLVITFAVVVGIMVFISFDELLSAVKTYDKTHGGEFYFVKFLS